MNTATLERTKEREIKKLEKKLKNVPTKKLHAFAMDERRDLALDDLFYHDKYILGYKDMTERTHRSMCHFVSDWSSGRNKKLLIGPRDCFKSCLNTIGQAPRLIAENPNVKILIMSETQGQAKAYLSAIQTHLSTNKKFKQTNLHLCNDYYFSIWNSECINLVPKGEKDDVDLDKEHTIDIAGIGTAKVGMHYDYIFFVDPHSERNIQTDAQIHKVINSYRLLDSILKAKTGRLIVEMTRWHYFDVAEHILRTEPDQFDVFIKSAEDRNPDGTLFFPERLDEEFLRKKLETLGTHLYSCNPAEAPVLMSNWTVKPIAEIKAGDEVVGFKRNEDNRVKLCKTKVLATGTRLSMVQKVFLESGKVIRCTPDHHWFTGRKSSSLEPKRKEYLPARTGSQLRFLCDPEIGEYTNEQKLKAHWLGGIFDGEGSVCATNIVINQSRFHNEKVCVELEKTFKILGFDYGNGYRKPSNTALGKGCESFWIRGGLKEKRRFLLLCDPVKKETLVDRLYKFRQFEKDRVVKIEPDRFETVYSFQTETGNYIVWGYASRNCLYLASPQSDKDKIFKPEIAQFYKVLPPGLRKIALLDPSISEKENADTFALLGIGLNNMNYAQYLIDKRKINRKLPAQAVGELILFLQDNFSDQERWEIAIEAHAFQKIYKFEIERELSKQRKLFTVHELQPGGRAKKSRITALQPFYESGKMFFREGPEGAASPDLDILRQFERFPFNTGDDDFIDAWAYILDILEPKREEESPYKRERTRYYQRVKQAQQGKQSSLRRRYS